jgi:hypothetical protein
MTDPQLTTMVNYVLTIHMYLQMLDGYQKIVENQARFQVGFQVEYLHVLFKVIPYLKPVH